MAVFISYSHADKELVERIANDLILSRNKVWLDRWELKVGDSLLDRIQDAIDTASALLVVLSQRSIESEWCKKELTSGLLKELEEKNVFVLPVRVDDCKFPLFLRDKVYADFRTKYSDGIEAIRDALAGATSLDMGRVVGGEYTTDWAEDWGDADGLTRMKFTLLQSSPKWKHCFLTEIVVAANAEATRRYQNYVRGDLDWFGRFVILTHVAMGIGEQDVRLVIEDNFPVERTVGVRDSKLGLSYDVQFSSRRLGEATSMNTLIDCGEIMRMVHSQVASRLPKFTSEQQRSAMEIAAAHG